VLTVFKADKTQNKYCVQDHFNYETSAQVYSRSR